MIGRNSKLVQVTISKNCLDFIKKYNQVFGGTVSSFIKNATEHYILSHCNFNGDEK